MRPPPWPDDTKHAGNRRQAAIPGGPDTTFHLLERVRAGDEAALEALFARYPVPLRR